MPSRCRVCFRPIPVAAKRGRGRPASYCRPADGVKRSPCKDFGDRLALLQQTVDAIPFTADGADHIRAALVALSGEVSSCD